MEKLQPMDEQVVAGLKHATASGFGDEIWLTFYLSGAENHLARMAAVLQQEGWINTDGFESGFIYPKTRAKAAAAEVLKVGEKVEELCDLYGVELISIDADSSPEVQRSKFITLYSA